MAEAGNHHFRVIGAGRSRLAPIVLLHGSSASEEALVPYGSRIARERTLIAVRGRVPWQGGYAFFRRHADRTLDHADLAERCIEFCAFLDHLRILGHGMPILVGFSNGAIMAAATIARAPDRSSGAVLLRALSPFAGRALPALRRYPVLLIGGVTDIRRQPSDTPYLAEEFRRAGAAVTEHVLPIGHNLDEAGSDASLAYDWIAARG